VSGLAEAGNLAITEMGKLLPRGIWKDLADHEILIANDRDVLTILRCCSQMQSLHVKSLSLVVQAHATLLHMPPPITTAVPGMGSPLASPGGSSGSGGIMGGSNSMMAGRKILPLGNALGRVTAHAMATTARILAAATNTSGSVMDTISVNSSAPSSGVMPSRTLSSASSTATNADAVAAAANAALTTGLNISAANSNADALTNSDPNSEAVTPITFRSPITGPRSLIEARAALMAAEGKQQQQGSSNIGGDGLMSPQIGGGNRVTWGRQSSTMTYSGAGMSPTTDSLRSSPLHATVHTRSLLTQSHFKVFPYTQLHFLGFALSQSPHFG
jgi:hypothetical protein